MKALSIKQPWSWLICAGYKDVENRSWRIGRKPSPGMMSTDWTGGKLPMRIYVHAAKSFDNEGMDFLTSNDPDVPNEFVAYAVVDHTSAYYALMGKEIVEYPRGAIIGEVTITGCVDKCNSPWFVGPYGFVLADPVLYDKPIPYKGQLGFFEVKLEAQTEVKQDGHGSSMAQEVE